MYVYMLARIYTYTYILNAIAISKETTTKEKDWKKGRKVQVSSCKGEASKVEEI